MPEIPCSVCNGKGTIPKLHSPIYDKSNYDLAEEIHRMLFEDEEFLSKGKNRGNLLALSHELKSRLKNEQEAMEVSH